MSKQIILIPLLGMLPLMMAATTAGSGFAIGAVFGLVFLFSSLLVLASRRFFSAATQWLLLLAITATTVSLAEQLLQLGFYALHVELGIYLPLIAMNTLLIGGLQDYLLQQPASAALRPVLLITLLVPLLCFITGLVRENPVLPIFAESPGLFLFAALALALFQALYQTDSARYPKQPSHQ